MSENCDYDVKILMSDIESFCDYNHRFLDNYKALLDNYLAVLKVFPSDLVDHDLNVALNAEIEVIRHFNCRIMDDHAVLFNNYIDLVNLLTKIVYRAKKEEK